jgi:hypothetical protein
LIPLRKLARTQIMRVEGGCHCGAVRFAAEVPAAVELLDCNCSICSLTGFLHLIVPHADFQLLAGEKALTSYRFGTGARQPPLLLHVRREELLPAPLASGSVERQLQRRHRAR